MNNICVKILQIRIKMVKFSKLGAKIDIFFKYIKTEKRNRHQNEYLKIHGLKEIKIECI